MKRTLLGLCLLLAAGAVGSRAAQTGVVKGNRLNVRGQPNLVGEVITQIKQGETIIILAETNHANPKPDEPAKWYQIKMPENTPVWVFADYIDPVTKTVTGSRLNLRAGPGENYSIVGRLNQGDPVKDIRTVESWMEIETPESAYGFVAADMVEVTGHVATAPASPNKYANEPPKLESNPADPAPGATAKNDPPPPAQTVKQVENQAPPAIAGNTKEAPAQRTQPSPPREAKPPAETAAQTPPSPGPAQPRPSSSVSNSTPPAVKSAAAPTPAPRRVVRREGIVRGTSSIQAPTYYELINAETRKTVEYLHAGGAEVQLKDYKGKHVIVTGEEGIDPRWPNVPVLEIETLELAP